MQGWKVIQPFFIVFHKIFTKFLVNKQGDAVTRFASVTKPEALAKDIESALA